MGQVTMVDTERGFVLVRSPLAAQVAAESRLVIRTAEGAGSMAQLKVSPERKRNMIAADILEGVPVVGAVVFFPTTEKVVSTEPPRLEAYDVGAADLGGGGPAVGWRLGAGLVAGQMSCRRWGSHRVRLSKCLIFQILSCRANCLGKAAKISRSHRLARL
jgi:hypothetical protein